MESDCRQHAEEGDDAYKPSMCPKCFDQADYIDVIVDCVFLLVHECRQKFKIKIYYIINF